MKRRGFLKWFGLAPVAAVAAKAAAAVESLPDLPEMSGSERIVDEYLEGIDVPEGENGDVLTVTEGGDIKWSSTITQDEWEPTYFGSQAGSTITTGTNNVAIGYGASQPIFVGYNTLDTDPTDAILRRKS